MKKSLVTLALIGAISTSAFAESNQAADDKWVFRGTVAYIDPNDSSGEVLGNDGVSTSSSTGIGLSITYMIDQNWGFEVLGALPFSHDITGTGDLAGLAIGETKQLPPTFSLTYSWGDNTRYHVGAGVNYTIFFSEKTSQALTDALAADTTDLSLDSSVGYALQAGFDTPISKDWSLSAGVYYIDLDTTADVYVNGDKAASVDVQIDPLVWMLGVSTTF